MNELESIVYILDNNQMMLDYLSWVINTIGLKTKTYSDSQYFLEEYNSQKPGCLVINVNMARIDGLAIQQIILNKGAPLIPIIFISDHDDILSAVRGIKNGALDFMLKPVNQYLFLENINKALYLDKKNREKIQTIAQIKSKFTNLSLREKQILKGIIDGKSNKEISLDINLTLKTVEAHRASLMKKMSTKSVSTLIRLYYSAGNIY
jgi:two-component system response regulator FixJ